jgi:hypothetical protein
MIGAFGKGVSKGCAKTGFNSALKKYKSGFIW